MTKYALRRLAIAIPTLLIISLVVFTVLALAPGDPLSQFAASPELPPEVRENIRKQFGLDDPIHVRYVKWLTNFVNGDWGFSFASRSPASGLIAQRVPTTLWVIGSAYLVAVLIAIPLGVATAARQYSWFDHIATGLSFAGFSLPTFFTGVLLIIIFSVQLRWLPMVYDQQVIDPVLWIKQATMPIMVLALFQGATLNRYVRASMLDNLNQDYARTARAKGLAEHSLVIRHVLRNALVPVVTLIALQLPTVFTGAVVTEQIFRVPGIGSLLISSIQSNDTPVIMSIIMVFSLLVVFFTLVADLFYGVLDPRVRYG
ncbi:MAG TPA: ABC transporter permease [Chloroflexota bacterium]|nr:ABC transporter permease [Chloroflexota bacterium]